MNNRQPATYLRAFTIMEVMVTLVLSGIIIAAALSLYLNFENLVRLKNNQINCGKENLQFYQIFQHEYDQATSVSIIQKQVNLLLPGRTNIQYEFNPNYILRNYKDLTDTFHIKVVDFETTPDEVTGWNKTVKMELHNCGEVYPVYLVKQYANDVLMNR